MKWTVGPIDITCSTHNIYRFYVYGKWNEMREDGRAAMPKPIPEINSPKKGVLSCVNS